MNTAWESELISVACSSHRSRGWAGPSEWWRRSCGITETPVPVVETSRSSVSNAPPLSIERQGDVGDQCNPIDSSTGSALVSGAIQARGNAAMLSCGRSSSLRKFILRAGPVAGAGSGTERRALTTGWSEHDKHGSSGCASRSCIRGGTIGEDKEASHDAVDAT